MTAFRHLLIACCLLAGPGLWGQEGSRTASVKFFASQGQRDAHFEQQQFFETEQDEWDFWKDQRAYEQRLSDTSSAAYSAYILSKREAYRFHQRGCSQECGHGDYYYLQAAYYLQYGEGDAAVSYAPKTGEEPLLLVRN